MNGMVGVTIHVGLPGKFKKSGHFCLHGFSKILSPVQIRARFCTNFVHHLQLLHSNGTSP